MGATYRRHRLVTDRRILAFALIVLGVPACAETSTPADLPGLWVLTTVDTQQAPPFITHRGCLASGRVFIEELVADSIALDATRNVRRRDITRLTEFQDSVPTGPPLVLDRISVGAYATTQAAVIGPADDAVYRTWGRHHRVTPLVATAGTS